MPFPRPAVGRIAAHAVAAVLAALAWIAASPTSAADPDTLWHIVHDLCAPNMSGAGDPTPCTLVNLTGGYAVLKDIRGATQLLLIPTDKVTGIESPRLLEPGSPNYWRDAWDARGLFEKRAGRAVTRDEIGLAVNSMYGRSQNQLHIHIDCVRPDVRAALRANVTRIGWRWSKLNVVLAGHRYQVRRLDGAGLGPRDPFKLLAAGDVAARADMSSETLAVIGAIFPGGKPGFVLLSDRADQATGDNASSEDLLDHGCAVLAPSTSASGERPPPPG